MTTTPSPRPGSNIDRALAALRRLHENGERSPTTERVMAEMRDDRPAAYGALNSLLQRGVVQRGGSGKTDGAGRKPVRWRIKPVIQGG